jgi:DNA end-binding protein Ku
VIEVEHFVAEEEIDPIFYERAYYLSPGKLGEEPYRVLHAALLQTGRVGIGRFVFHNKAHLAAVRALDDAIVMQTMRFAEEIVPESQIELPRARRKASKLELDTAQLLIDQLDADFEPDGYEDAYREQLLALIERKAAGETIEPPEREPDTPEADLLDVLKQSVERHGARRRRRAAAGTGSGAGAERASGKSSVSRPGRKGDVR